MGRSERTYYVATEYGITAVRASTAESARRACALDGVHGRVCTRPADAERECERAGQRAQAEVEEAVREAMDEDD